MGNNNRYIQRGNLLVEHDGSAISVFDKHPDEGHTDENIVGIVVLWKRNEYHKDTVKSSHY